MSARPQVPRLIKETLKIDGIPFADRSVPPAVLRTIAHLETLPDDEIMTTPKLVAAMRMNYNNFKQYATHCSLEPYRAKLGKMTGWGNRKAITTLHRLQEAK